VHPQVPEFAAELEDMPPLDPAHAVAEQGAIAGIHRIVVVTDRRHADAVDGGTESDFGKIADANVSEAELFGPPALM
jgi:hypothetical protein